MAKKNNDWGLEQDAKPPLEGGSAKTSNHSLSFQGKRQ